MTLTKVLGKKYTGSYKGHAIRVEYRFGYRHRIYQIQIGNTGYDVDEVGNEFHTLQEVKAFIQTQTK